MISNGLQLLVTNKKHQGKNSFKSPPYVICNTLPSLTHLKLVVNSFYYLIYHRNFHTAPKLFVIHYIHHFNDIIIINYLSFIILAKHN